MKGERERRNCIRSERVEGREGENGNRDSRGKGDDGRREKGKERNVRRN